MFNIIKNKIIAGLSILVTIMFVALKFISNKNNKLEREIKVKSKQVEIRNDQDEIKKEVIKNEGSKIEEAKSNLNGSRADKLNSVLNNRDNT